MRARAMAVLGALVAMGFAGCATPVNSPNVATDDTVRGPQATFDAEHGGIEGTVTDESLVPVEDATVTLVGNADRAVTDAAGRFAFSLLEAGSYVLDVTADGYLAASSPVSVRQGELTRTSFRLSPIASADAFDVTTILEGRLGCSVAGYVRPIDRWQPANLCGIGAVQDEYLVSAPLAGTDVTKMQTFLTETRWESTQLLGSGLNIRISIEGDASESNDPYQSPFWDVRGQSPLRFELNRTALETLAHDDPSFYGGCNPNATCVFDLAAYPWPNTLGDAYPADVGLNLDQRFTHYVTEFYYLPAPESFSAIPDQ